VRLRQWFDAIGTALVVTLHERKIPFAIPYICLQLYLRCSRPHEELERWLVALPLGAVNVANAPLSVLVNGAILNRLGALPGTWRLASLSKCPAVGGLSKMDEAYMEPPAAIAPHAPLKKKPATLAFRFLGQFSVLGSDSWQAGPSPKKGGELLRYLGVYPRRIATKDELAVSFWPDLDADAVAHRLHLAASGARAYLRLRLGVPDAILCVVGGYAWSPETRVRTDVEDFLALCKDGSSQSLEAAVGLYTGELLAGENADWLQPMRIRCASAYACALELLAIQAEAAQDFAAALNAAFKLQESERGHEGATRLIMRCFAALGQRDRAVSQYESLRGYLLERLGVEPTQETTILARRIKVGTIPMYARRGQELS
jgi:DNA-binding SARP family transcriptional activator